MHRRRLLGVAAFLLVCAAAGGVPTPAAAHINHVAADPQLSPDGTLVAESVFVADDGFLVVHQNDGGEMGEPVGHVAVDSDGGIKTDVRVTVDEDVWTDWDSGALWFVLHNDDGDGEFTPSDDRPLRAFGQAAGTLVAVEKGERAFVTAAGKAPQQTEEPNVTVRKVRLPRDGQLLVRNATSDRLLGHTNLSAGAHDRVRVSLNESAVAGRDRLSLEAVVAGPDGTPVTADGEPVATRFAVRYASDGEVTASATPKGDQTATNGGDGDATDDAPSPTSETTMSETPVTTERSQPGFGVAAALAALSVGALLARGRW